MSKKCKYTAGHGQNIWHGDA